jgi:hypothetical protein
VDPLVETRKKIKDVMGQLFEVPGGLDAVELNLRRELYAGLKTLDAF